MEGRGKAGWGGRCGVGVAIKEGKEWERHLIDMPNGKLSQHQAQAPVTTFSPLAPLPHHKIMPMPVKSLQTAQCCLSFSPPSSSSSTLLLLLLFLPLFLPSSSFPPPGSLPASQCRPPNVCLPVTTNQPHKREVCACENSAVWQAGRKWQAVQCGRQCSVRQCVQPPAKRE